ncbi:MAG: flagellar hook-basal body complex protein [Deltaproteobacteria bacterium]|nr:flagellar hook-basal body complex protein [Deltaproteobacteria bacterium]
MGISSSLYSSISGLNTMGEAMSVLSDNVANVNTVAFKSNRSTFQDVLSQAVSTATGSAQIGRGVTLSTVDGLFAQGAFESTSTATDLAIGGQGFFMLRTENSSQADMYSRAGEFRFDEKGNLVSPAGYYVQGWSIDPDTGQKEGTIGDITIDTSTPPVETEKVDVVVNLDSGVENETVSIPLYEAWEGMNAAAVVPRDPINSENYNYSTSLAIYDSKGASHDITIYFDRTNNNNEWEFLVTCDPAEDQRVLEGDELTTYAPNTTYDYEVNTGAGALLYGVINFNTSGDITNIFAWNVPPDGKVDPALSENRLILEPGDSFYSFEANFTGAATNQTVELNFGAAFSGLMTSQNQILVSKNGAFSNLDMTAPVTSETSWDSVYDSVGNVMSDGDIFTFTGYSNDGTAVSGQYVVNAEDNVQDLLDALGSTFGATVTIDAAGRLKITDNTGGDSALAVSSFTTSSLTGAEPFGGGDLVLNQWAVSSAAASSDGGATVIGDPTTLLTAIGDGTDTVTAGDTFTFTGTAIDGTDVTLAGNNVFIVGATSTIQDLLDFISALYEDGDSGSAGTGTLAVDLDGNGMLRIVDSTFSGNLDVSMSFTDTDSSGFTDPFGGSFAMQDAISGQINITTSRTEVISSGRALSTPSGTPPAITADTSWNSVYSATSPGIAASDVISFSGTKGDGTAVSVSYNIDAAIADEETVQDLLDLLEEEFNADASIDEAGRMILRDRTADTSSEISSLSLIITNYGTGPEIFGEAGTAFETISADLLSDGSCEGDVVSSLFESEALTSTQYANSSTTTYQDQDGFASGFLQSVSVDTEGIITGQYSNGQVLAKAQVALANFQNLNGLYKEGGNIYKETTESGSPITGVPGSNGLGSISSNSLEQSNVDLSNEFVKLITTQRGFQANSKIITTADEMLQDLINIIR